MTAGPAAAIGVDRFAAARAVADAVLYEGYVLYPYRASARKNQLRWQFGVLAPPLRRRRRVGALVDAHGGDRRSRTRGDDQRSRPLPAGPAAQPRVVRRRGLLACRSPRRRRRPVDAVGRSGRARDRSRARSRSCRCPEERPRWPSISREVTIERWSPRRRSPRRTRLSGARSTTGPPCTVACASASEWADGEAALLKVVTEVENTTDWSAAGASRDDVMLRSLVGVHTLLAVEDGAFVSLLDPPEYAGRCGGRLPQRRHVPGARRPQRRNRCGAVVADHPLRPSGGGPRERRRLLRRHRDRRDPRPPGAHPDGRREGRSAWHRSPGGGDRRPVRRHATGDVGAVARRHPLAAAGSGHGSRGVRRSRGCRRSRGGAVVGSRLGRVGRSVDGLDRHRRRRGRRRHPRPVAPVAGEPTPTTSSTPGVSPS